LLQTQKQSHVVPVLVVHKLFFFMSIRQIILTCCFCYFAAGST